MKRFITILALVLLFPVMSFAAGSFKVTNDFTITNNWTREVTQRVLTCTYTADGSANIPALTLNNSTWTDGTNSGTFNRGDHLTGWFLYQVEIDGNHAGTEIKENGDLTIKKNGFDLLAGNGVNQMDNSAERMVFASDGVSSILAPITDSIVIHADAADENDVNAATGTIKLILVPAN